MTEMQRSREQEQPEHRTTSSAVIAASGALVLMCSATACLAGRNPVLGPYPLFLPDFRDSSTALMMDSSGLRLPNTVGSPMERLIMSLVGLGVGAFWAPCSPGQAGSGRRMAETRRP